MALTFRINVKNMTRQQNEGMHYQQNYILYIFTKDIQLNTAGAEYLVTIIEEITSLVALSG